MADAVDMSGWTETAPGETWERKHDGRTAHLMAHGGGVMWVIDGGACGDADGLLAAKSAAELALGLVGWCAELDPAKLPLLAPSVAPTPPPGSVDPFEPNCPNMSATQLAAVERANLALGRDIGRPLHPRRAGADFEVRPRPLASRILDRAPSEVQAQMRERTERVGGYQAAIRAFAEEETADPALLAEMLAEMLAEAEREATVVAESALEVRRELETSRALAQGRLELAREEEKRAKAAIAETDAAIARLETRVLRPLCESVGKGPTRAVHGMTGRVSIVKNPSKVVLDEDLEAVLALLPDSLVRIERKPNREAILAELKAGRPVPGADLVQTTRIEVKG